MMVSVIVHMPANKVSLAHLSIANLEVIPEYESSEAASFNLGLRKAKGDYIWFLTEKDEITNDALSIVERLINGKEDVFVFDYSIIYPDRYRENNYANTYYSSAAQFIPMIMQNRFASFLCNKIFRKETLQKTGLLFNKDLHFFYEKLFLLSLYQMQSISTKYISLNVVSHYLPISRSEFHSLLYPVSKDGIVEYPFFFRLAKPVIGKEFERMLDQDALEYKRNLCLLGYLAWGDFNSFCRTPISLIWKPIFTIRQSARLTIDYYFHII